MAADTPSTVALGPQVGLELGEDRSIKERTRDHGQGAPVSVVDVQEKSFPKANLINGRTLYQRPCDAIRGDHACAHLRHGVGLGTAGSATG